MEQVVPWKSLAELIEQLYPEAWANQGDARGTREARHGERRGVSVRAKVGASIVRTKVGHQFRVSKRQLGLMKDRLGGLATNTTHVVTLFALSNLWVAYRQLLIDNFNELVQTFPNWGSSAHYYESNSRN